MLIPDELRNQVRDVIQQAENTIAKITGKEIKLECDELRPDILKRDRMLRSFVCDVCAIEWSQITAKTRKREIVRARQLYCYFARSWLKMTYRAIGQIVGGRDHTKAIHSIQTVKDLLDSRDDYVSFAHKQISIKIKAATI